ncbi:membrane protein [Streptomyces laurentii]|uniref:Membrane protein n=1 Tax=Streptomyces laurentii TaxID=39478 RepID=A0A160NY73_STRLU|nr:membrane protein [Streptomyces laurentii]
MTGRGQPPEVPPPEPPGGGEDEYRSVVFDEAFIRAARLQEFSAQERMGEHAQAVRPRPGRGGRRTGARQALLLVLLVLLAFGTAVYLGVRNPYQIPQVQPTEPLRSTVVRLVPEGPVPGGPAAGLFAHSPAAAYRTGAAGIVLPPAAATTSFSEGQVRAALGIAKDYLVASSLDPGVLAGRTVGPARTLLDPDQQPQFDRSVGGTSRDDGRHAVSGWLVRFDPHQAVLADPAVRVQGAVHYAEVAGDQLEVTSDHTFTYAVRPAASGKAPADRASLYTVHRELRFRFDRQDLQTHRTELLISTVEAGPQSCDTDTSGALRPLLAGERADRTHPAVTDPYTTGQPAPSALCGVLAPKAQPSP